MANSGSLRRAEGAPPVADSVYARSTLDSAGARNANAGMAIRFSQKLKTFFLQLKSARRVIGLTALAAFALAPLFFASCSSLNGTVMAPLEIPGAHYVGNKACADCHAELVRKFPASPHARVHFETGKMAGESGCESCHGPGSRHVESPDHKFILNPGKDSAACFQCHLETHAEFNLPQHHPVIEGKMNCVQCHDPHGGDIQKRAGGLAMARLNESCAQCHREQTRPFVFEHEALREGCATCHNPHGSPNRKMLTQPDNNLCLRCHSQNQAGGGLYGNNGSIYIGKVDHTSLLQLGSCWAAGCHTAVHGSNVDPRLRY